MKVLATYAMNQFGGLEITDINEADNTIEYRYNFGKPEEVCTTTLYEDGTFKTYTTQVFDLADFMRVA